MRNLDDAAAYMLLVTSNAQSELTALERGRHALKSGMEIKAYAESVGRQKQWRNVYNEVYAAEVVRSVADICNDLSAHFSQLVEIHAAPSWLWPALVTAMLKNEWTVNGTREHVGRFKGLPAEEPEWLAPTVAEKLVADEMKPSDIKRMAEYIERAE